MDARRSRLEQASSSVQKVKEQTVVKSSNSPNEKDRRVIIGSMPCVVVTSLETDAFVAFVAFFDMLMVRSNLSARSRKEGTQGAVAFLREKKRSKVVYLKTQIQ